ncbi:N-acetylmuramoyl-L-alanine amidase family protein [Helicobacter cynogastricus]|uniref:N-acetylmuramoyl-L-alanine amidase family protein n=1 Tax=Helicobacter cynogastricus TaxID=329937 RepID=UPI000CF0B689|nr:N-acetylmuramoyl-L-alanine amidase [Helicobacter cynogastricus]
MRFILCLLIGIYAHALSITQVVPFGSSSVRISFDHNLGKHHVKQTRLGKFESVLDIKAHFKFPTKYYHFDNQTSISVAQGKVGSTKVILLYPEGAYQIRRADNHLYIIITTPHATSPAPTPSSPLQPSLSKHFKVVLDAGHGGHDCGARGVNGVCEKWIVLAVAKFLKQELLKRGYIVFMTRSNDTYISLKDRTDFANNKSADLFISIHANSIPHHSPTNPQGVETYFLSTARSERARKVAEQENQDDVKVMDYFSKLSFLNSLNSQRLITSNKLAIDIQFGILSQLRHTYKHVIDGGVREGPFWVLAGALMPSVLIEIGYNSNPFEAKRIQNKRYQQGLAKGIANGVDSFVSKNF